MTDPETRRHQGAVSATVAGILDRVRGGRRRLDLPDDLRLDGRTAVVTGATRGLGRAIATRLAALGARVVITGRSGIDAAVDAIRTASGGEVEGLQVDLSDPASVAALAEALGSRAPIDVLVLNAGIVPSRSRTTPSGVDVMTHVHLVGNVQLVDHLLAAGALGTTDDGGDPRIVVVGSESHRSASVDPDHWLEPRTYGTSEVIGEYGRSKLLLHLWAVELAERLRGRVAVHHLCPGPIDSDIAREAPSFLLPVLRVVFRAFFQSPDVAARPVVWLAVSPELRGETGRYLHMTERRDPSPTTADAALRGRLWDDVHALLACVTPED